MTAHARVRPWMGTAIAALGMFVVAPSLRAQQDPDPVRMPGVTKPPARARPKPAPVEAQTTEVAPTPLGADRWLVFAREMDFAEVISSASNVLGIPIDFDPAEIKGKVALRVPESVTPAEFWRIANQALASRGFATIQSPGSGSISVVPIASAAGLARLEESGLASAKAGFVKVLFRLEHERADAAADAIKLVLSKSGSVNALKEARSVIVTDFAPNVAQAGRVADVIDVSNEDFSVDEIPLERAGAPNIVAVLEQVRAAQKLVFGTNPRGSVLAHPSGKALLVIAPRGEHALWGELIRQFDQAEAVRTAHYTPHRFGLKETAKLVEDVVRGTAASSDAWRMVVDELTGTLVITTTASRHAEVEKLFDRLEETQGDARKPLRSFAIRNRGVEELRGMLQGLLDAGALKEALKQSAPLAASAPAQGVTAPLASTSTAPSSMTTDKLGEEVILTVDKATNRLVAMGNGRALDELGKLIKELDVKTPQVLVEVMVVTLTENQTRSLGVEMQRLGHDGDVEVKLATLFGLGSPDPTGPGLPASSGTGFSGVVLDPGTFSAAVRALETVNHGRTMTIPKVLVNNNQPATLNSVVQTPFASTNASTTVATTTFGGTLDAGTTISVTPQIADGDLLVLDCQVSLSAFVGAATATLPPPRQENSLKSLVTVPDGYAIVVGGLEVKMESEGRTQVPILGDIPLIGALFGTRTKSEDRARFFVFIRCSVQRSQTFEDLRYVSAPALEAAGVDDGWPKVEPRWIK